MVPAKALGDAGQFRLVPLCLATWQTESRKDWKGQSLASPGGKENVQGVPLEERF